jgi:hypothetical protein
VSAESEKNEGLAEAQRHRNTAFTRSNYKFGAYPMKGKLAFWIIGFGLFGLGMASSLLYLAWQIKTGHGGDTSYNSRLQPITHWGYVGTLAIALVAVIVGLAYQGREMLERHKHAKRTAEQSVAPDRTDERRDS